MDFAVHHIIRHHMPDNDRLVNVKYWDDGLIVCEYRFGYINRLLVQQLNDLSRGITGSGALQLDYDNRERTPQVMCWFEAGELAIPVRARVGRGDGLPMFFEIQCRSEDIDSAILRELNEYAMPEVCAVILPYGLAIPA